MVGMSSVEAIGAYLKTIREYEGLTGAEVLARILRMVPDVDPVPNTGTISKIEQGKQKSNGLRLVALINRALRGNPAHIQILASDDKSSRTKGVQLAQEWLALTPAERDQIIDLTEKVGPGVVVAAARALLNRL